MERNDINQMYSKIFGGNINTNTKTKNNKYEYIPSDLKYKDQNNLQKLFEENRKLKAIIEKLTKELEEVKK